MDMELENMLRPPEITRPPYPAKVITLASGKKMVVRQVGLKDIPLLLKVVKPAMERQVMRRNLGHGCLPKSDSSQAAS